MSNFHKYLKYKNKYLNLKIGGAAAATSNAFDFCDCARCKKIAEYSREKIWFNTGIRTISESEFNKLDGNVNPSILFAPPLSKTKDGKFGTLSKPNGVWWFSNGSWLFDPLFNIEHKSPEITKSIEKCVMIKNPYNILEINTFEELDKFVDDYCVKKPNIKTLIKNEFIAIYDDKYFPASVKNKSTEVEKICKELKIDFSKVEQYICEQFDLDNRASTIEYVKYISQKFLLENVDLELFDKDDNLTPLGRKIREVLENNMDGIIYNYLSKKPDENEPVYNSIDWDEIAKKYYGVAFNFRKVFHISNRDYDRSKFKWHAGYDVETLIIFDLKALVDVSVVCVDVDTLSICDKGTICETSAIPSFSTIINSLFRDTP